MIPFNWSDQCVYAQAFGSNVKVEVQQDYKKVTIFGNNRSNSRSLLICVSVITATVTLISIIMAFLGAWLIAPFAGAEVLLLTITALILRSRKNDCDSLVVSDTHVHLTRKRHPNVSVHSFVRQWTDVKLTCENKAHTLPRLLVGCHGKYQEVGEQLVRASKIRLYQHLNDWISDNIHRA